MSEIIKVMVVEDSRVLRVTAEGFLKDKKYQVVLAEDGYEALAKLETEKPDIIFIDVMMPKLDGYETCQIIKSNETYKKIPIIFVSGKDGEFDKVKGVLIGGSDYITKPYKREEMLNAIEKYCGN